MTTFFEQVKDTIINNMQTLYIVYYGIFMQITMCKYGKQYADFALQSQTNLYLTCGSLIVNRMISFQFLSTVKKRRPSSGICCIMSSELKIGSK